MRVEFKPREYQPIAIDFMLNTPRCAVWAGMGLGKSVSALTALDLLFLAGEETRPALVVAPLRVAQSTWPEEAEKWSHLRHIEVIALVGSARERHHKLFKGLATGNTSIFTINYENVPWLVETLAAAGAGWPFGTVVADESTKLKGFRLRQGTQRAKALAKHAHNKTQRWINLTGTPSPNGLVDLWGQTWFLDGGARLGRTYDAFRQRWFQKSYDGFSTTPLPFAQEQIEDKLRDICLTLDPADYFDLQQPIVNNIFVDLPSKARALYKRMEKEMFMEIGEHEIEAFNAASRTIKCLQLANGAAYVNGGNEQWEEVHDAKLQALEDVVEEAAGMPVLVAYHFKSDLARLQRTFSKGRTLDADPATIQQWNRGDIPVLFAHPASAGHGINLQDGGNIIAFFGHWWNLEEYQQIIERLGPVRQLQAGHNRPVFIHHIIARGTVDELVMMRREGKKEVQELLLEAMKRSH